MIGPRTRGAFILFRVIETQKSRSGISGGGGPDVSFRAYISTAVRRLAYEQTEKTRKTLVTDDFKVVSVNVRIENSNGNLIEEGSASLLPDGLNWMYVSTVANTSVAGTTISFIAKDLPGHSFTKLKTL